MLRSRTSISDMPPHEDNGRFGYLNGNGHRDDLGYKEQFGDQDIGNGSVYGSRQYTPHERRTSFLRRNRKTLISVGLVLLLLFAISATRPDKHIPISWKSKSWSSSSGSATMVSGFTGSRNTITFTNGTRFSKPASMKIVGVIFFGRAQFVNVLECYLRRNLRVNGGMLDEIHFLMHTDKAADKHWLSDMIQSSGLGKYYKKKQEDTSGDWNLWTSYPNLYRDFMTDPDTIYIKIDDDLLFIDDYAIQELVRVTLEHPEAHSVQANIVNNKWNYWHHLHSNAVRPFLPERDVSTSWPVSSWRPSELPPYKGELPPRNTNFTDHWLPPHTGHRWLPLEPTYASLAHTPYGSRIPGPDGHTRESKAGWALTAQTHFSFFTNHERGELQRYSYGNDHDHTWNQWYKRYNINLFAIRGSHVSKKPFWDGAFPNLDKGDEFLLTTIIPQSLDMPVLVATRAIAAHFSFRGDRNLLLKSDVLDRYEALANELYCPANTMLSRLGRPLSAHQKPSSKGPLISPSDASFGGDEVGDGPQDLINKDDSTADDDDGSYGEYDETPKHAA